MFIRFCFITAADEGESHGLLIRACLLQYLPKCFTDTGCWFWSLCTPSVTKRTQYDTLQQSFDAFNFSEESSSDSSLKLVQDFSFFPLKYTKKPQNIMKRVAHILWTTDYYIVTVIMRPEWIKWYDRCEESRLFLFLASVHVCLILHSLRCWWENIESRKTSELSTALEKSKSCDSRPLRAWQPLLTSSVRRPSTGYYVKEWASQLATSKSHQSRRRLCVSVTTFLPSSDRVRFLW